MVVLVNDRLSPFQRSRVMSRIRGKNTAPEMLVRGMVRGMGFGYRLHRRDLPGSPDLVFAGRKKVIFVHGCFWHQHACARGKRPSSNRRFWNSKLDANVQRDKRNIAALKDDNWQVLVVWECETKDRTKLSERLEEFLRN